MSNISKSVSNRIRNAQVVTTSFEVHGPDVIEDLANVFQKANIPDFDANAARSLLSTLSLLLINATSTLEQSETTYIAEIANDGDKRDLRDEATSELRDEIQYARTILSATANTSALRNWGILESAPVTPDTLIVYANYCVKQLRNNPRTVTRGKLSVSTTDFADTIDVPRAKLEAALEDLKRDSRENQLALEKRNDALDSWNVAYSTSASILADLYRLAGRQNLAKRVRPTRRRTSGQTNVDEETPEDILQADVEEYEASAADYKASIDDFAETEA